ncbi:MAG: hypothetical protein CMO40_01810 [Verrucomicrobiaceae bacterium]|nr:hypothetical protein [Verrucomicrobiaceae bacterium]
MRRDHRRASSAAKRNLDRIDQRRTARKEVELLPVELVPSLGQAPSAATSAEGAGERQGPTGAGYSPGVPIPPQSSRRTLSRKLIFLNPQDVLSFLSVLS